MSDSSQTGFKTDRGLKRPINEDSILVDEQLGLWLLADGMGGYQKGEVASRIAVETVRKLVAQDTALPEALQRAHEAINAAAESDDGAAGMGTTLVALQVRKAAYEIAWAGDSRAYLWNADNGFEQLTHDHSYLNTLISSGAVSKEEARNHSAGHILTSCLGSTSDQQPRIDRVNGWFAKGDTVMLCSDGVTGELTDEEIEVLLRRSEGPQDSADALVAAALENGGRDNISVIITPASEHLSAVSTALKKRGGWLSGVLAVLAGVFLAVIFLAMLIYFFPAR